MIAIRIVTIVFLGLYSARIAQAAHFGVSFAALLPYIGWVSSAFGLATWQIKGLPLTPLTLTFDRRQVALMIEYASIFDPTLELESPEDPAVQQFFNLKPEGAVFTWTEGQQEGAA